MKPIPPHAPSCFGLASCLLGIFLEYAPDACLCLLNTHHPLFLDMVLFIVGFDVASFRLQSQEKSLIIHDDKGNNGEYGLGYSTPLGVSHASEAHTVFFV